MHGSHVLIQLEWNFPTLIFLLSLFKWNLNDWYQIDSWEQTSTSFPDAESYQPHQESRSHNLRIADRHVIKRKKQKQKSDLSYHMNFRRSVTITFNHEGHLKQTTSQEGPSYFRLSQCTFIVIECGEESIRCCVSYMSGIIKLVVVTRWCEMPNESPPSFQKAALQKKNLIPGQFYEELQRYDDFILIRIVQNLQIRTASAYLLKDDWFVC